MLIAAGGLISLTRIGIGTGYAGHVLPGLLLMGFGLGLVFASAMATATFGVEPHDAGVASAMVNTMQQVGGSIGTALLSTLAASAVTSQLAGVVGRPARRWPKPRRRSTATRRPSGGRLGSTSAGRCWSRRC